MHNKGISEAYIYAEANRLKHLARNTDLNKPETVEQFIANKKRSNRYKQLLCEAYQRYTTYYNIPWKMPIYKPEEKMPKLPTEEQLIKLIAAAGKTLSLKLWISKETGIRPVELHNLLVRNIDTEHNTINPTTAKHGSARILKIPPSLTKAIQAHIIRNDLNPNDKLFKSNARKYGDNYRQMRNRLAKRTNDPALATVRLYDFRHYFGTMQYWKYRDLGLTAEDMGHKDWNTTRKYIHLARIIQLMNDDGFICKTAKDLNEAQQLIEHGFDYVSTMEGTQLFRKRK